MRYRPAVPAEADAVLSLVADGRAALRALDIDPWQGGNPTAEEIEADLANGRTRVAVGDDGRLLGTLAFVVGEPDYDRVLSGAWRVESPNDPARGEPRYAALHRLCVSARAKRQGVATFMVRQACEEARGLGLVAVRADTHEGNLPMQRTFEKCGMARCCTVDITNPLESTKLRLGYEIAL